MIRLILFSMLFASVFLFGALAYPTDTPETVTLDSLSTRYGPVEFSHGQHANIAGTCAKCHHHSPKGSTPACGECHESIIVYHYSTDKKGPDLGLKAAYHRQCMGCHEKMGSGPLGCTDCHEKKVKK
jgi:Class III cytochrome C family